MRGALLAGWIALLAGGCGDDLTGPQDCSDPAETVTGVLASVEEVSAPDGCIDGVVDFEIDGRWQLWINQSNFDFSFPKLSFTCGAFDLPDLSAETRVASYDGSTLFWRGEWPVDEASSFVLAIRGCWRADGAMAVTYATCDPFGACQELPAELTRFGRIAGEDEASGLTLLGESNGDTDPRLWSMNLRVRGGYAYVAQQGGLRIYDVSNPATPTQVGHWIDPLVLQGDFNFDNFNDVRVVDAGERRFAVLAGASTPIVEVTDPAAPVIVAQLNEYAHSVFIDEVDGRQELYLANYGQDVPIFDITDPTTPLPLGRAVGPPGLEIHDLFADDRVLYVNGTWLGFLVLDARQSIGQATLVRRVSASYSHNTWVATVGGRRVAIHGDEGHSAHMRIFDADLASPTFLNEIGSWQTRPGVSIHNITVVGDYAYVAYYHDGIRVIDLTDPTRPTQVAYFNTWDPETGGGDAFESAIGVDVDPATGLIYGLDMARGLLVLSHTP